MSRLPVTHTTITAIPGAGYRGKTQNPRIAPRAKIGQCQEFSGDLGCRVRDWIRGGAPDVSRKDRPGFLAISAGYDDSDRLFRLGDFTNLLHCILTDFELESVTSEMQYGTPGASYDSFAKSLFCIDLGN